jgi:hypothetical protein
MKQDQLTCVVTKVLPEAVAIGTPFFASNKSIASVTPRPNRSETNRQAITANDSVVIAISAMPSRKTQSANCNVPIIIVPKPSVFHNQVFWHSRNYEKTS